ncbi:unnamed protein product [Pieris macdunnoughi]|uniref:Uncharacterized protein n=1 Tax=Pieris macdunnoughi TaxID=345717 RepID=A0A821UL75_9NEOP|nr:unnamed protein product [Pieris macdunnoughi]
MVFSSAGNKKEQKTEAVGRESMINRGAELHSMIISPTNDNETSENKRDECKKKQYNERAKNMATPGVKCFGCGTPGVYSNKCLNCKSKETPPKICRNCAQLLLTLKMNLKQVHKREWKKQAGIEQDKMDERQVQGDGINTDTESDLSFIEPPPSKKKQSKDNKIVTEALQVLKTATEKFSDNSKM